MHAHGSHKDIQSFIYFNNRYAFPEYNHGLFINSHLQICPIASSNQEQREKAFTPSMKPELLCFKIQMHLSVLRKIFVMRNLTKTLFSPI